MNPTLSIESIAGTLVPDGSQTVTFAQGNTKEAAPTRRSISFRWPSCSFAEVNEAIIAFLTVIYLTGAVGFGAMLIFQTLQHG
jgi:hypothetical protein